MLNTVQWRLEETLQVFEVHRLLNQRCNKEDSPELNEVINRHPGFWQPVGVGLQTTLFLGINSILDKHRKDSATLYKCFDMLTREQQSRLSKNFVAELDEIRERYERFRHKLFGHNDMSREQVIKEFEGAGFSWESVAADLRLLQYALKALYHAAAGRDMPSATEADRMLYAHDIAAESTRRDTQAFIDLLQRVYSVKESL